jgi:hypothetical protein
MAEDVGGALCALVALLLAGPGPAHAIDPKTALDALGFPGEQIGAMKGLFRKG